MGLRTQLSDPCVAILALGCLSQDRLHVCVGMRDFSLRLDKNLYASWNSKSGIELIEPFEQS